MEEKVFVIRHGRVTALYDDRLRVLGPMRVERASDVEWDDDAQAWFARIRAGVAQCTGTMLGPFTTREEALAAEVAFIQARM